MSTFSSLILFYPGSPPAIKLHEARRFCEQLRQMLSLGNTLLGVDIKYGKSIDQDLQSTQEIDWDESGMLGQFAAYAWDHAQRGKNWPELWPRSAFDSRNLYRASVGLGNLPKTVSWELTAMRDEQTAHEFIAPDSLSFQIDPVCPATLSSQELVAYGLIELSFSGNGFFTWQPLARYWEQVRHSEVLAKVRQQCRETFPVPPINDLNTLKNDLGELFLNRDDYQIGDWIVSVTETG